MLGEIQNLRDGKNLKDSNLSNSVYIKDRHLSISYKKTNKLIAGLYMVTDIMDKDEPIRLRLRVLGVEILSDFASLPQGTLLQKVQEVLSFIDIAGAVGIASPMNCAILKKEFVQLQESIREAEEKLETGRRSSFFGGQSLLEFMKGGEEDEAVSVSKHKVNSIGHIGHTRIGVQKGHTLMKALSDRISGLSDSNPISREIPNFNALKEERRKEILKIIKNNSNGATITDIKNQAQGPLASCGEKTLQRELISMVKDNVLHKTGEKRWSRYFPSEAN